MKIKGLTLVVVLSVFVSAAYGEDRDKRKNGWEENGLYGRVESFAEQSFEDWTTNNKGERVGIDKGKDFFQLGFNRNGKEKVLERDYTSGGYEKKSNRKMVQYDRNANILYVLKRVKRTPTYELIKYYDDNKNFVKVREELRTDRTLRVVMRDLASGGEFIQEFLYDDQDWLVQQSVTFPNGEQQVRRFEYYRVDQQGNWLEAIYTTTQNGEETQELRIRTYRYYAN